MSAGDRDWDGVRLHVVTGKGGTGKTTLAASLALALASGGKKVLLVEVEGRQGIAQLFDCPPLPYEERRVAVAPRGGDVHALAVDPEAALLDYLEMFYGMRRAGQALTRFGVVDFATTIAPGARDVLLTGKATEAVRRRVRRDRADRAARRPEQARAPFVYDAVVLDAPPTGRIAQFLNVNAEVAGLAKVGPIRNHADRVMEVIRSPETVVHFVAMLEEMPAQECLDGMAEVRGVGLNIGGILVNMVRSPLLPPDHLATAGEGEVDIDALARGLKSAGLEQAEQTAQALSGEIVDHARRVRAEADVRDRLAGAGRPRYELPLITDGMDLAGLYRLADELREQGAA
ncbi:anion-transporting ArsA/GET3 family ATPase [Spinactinospora alkalitolerans]|uniref:Anion-transporting ArsA/GET3 family ATPase n=1 Tax=Spinactinospora alkalitolerans TaxID=687207 RepID=A0A852U223_9ACTN|nr:ArsA-related P-loop ATPase [Spinactinospora alkalitolerans]NYE50926.1 anion-transporting ArsA/GET3 family ATPase [Spinactinospora alkalitolerans]